MKGGVVTYVNVKIVQDTIVYRKEKEFLITITGKLVIVNVYLPQAGRYQDGCYEHAVSQIYSAVEELGVTYSFFLAGDYNSSNQNLRNFRFLKDMLELQDWSTISQLHTLVMVKEEPSWVPNWTMF